MRRPTFIAAAVVLAACTREPPSAPAMPNPLVGDWGVGPVALSPAGTLYQSLSFGSDGRFLHVVSTYGVYPGQGTGVSSVQRITGTYRTAGDGTIAFSADSLVTWDRLSTAGRQVVQTPYPFVTGPFDGARFEVASGQLALRYTTYPADAPVATTLTLYRMLPN